MFLVFRSILLSLSIFTIVHCQIWEPQNSAKEVVCKSDTCLKRGSEYFDNLNPAVNPCDDFYSFACGGWHVKNKPPEYLAEWSTVDVMEKRVIKDFKEILDNPTATPDREFLRVKNFYDICMKQPFLGRLNPKDVFAQILKVGRFGKKNIWDIHEDYLRLTGESAFFDYKTYSYRHADLIPLLFLREIESPYGAIFHEDWKLVEANNYSQFLFLLMKSIKLPVADSILKAKIKAVLQFRQKLNQISIASRNRKVMTITPMTATKYEQWIKESTQQKRSGMPWEKIIKTILAVVKVDIHNMAITTMRDDQYFKDLGKLLASNSQEVLADHMEMYFAERHTIFTSQLEDLLERTSIEPNDLLQPIRQDIPRHVSCIKGLNLWPEIGKLLQRKWFRKDITQPMIELVNGLKMAIIHQVKESSWLKHETKAETIKRILEVQTWIGYPPMFNDISANVKSNALENNPLEAEAFLDLNKFLIYIKSPLLRPPIYDPDLPNVYNIGAMGYIVGHELYHVIHDCGKYPNAKTEAAWWPPEVRHQCSTKMKCFIDSYNTQTQKEFDLTYHEQLKPGKRSTYLEDFPDVMGLEAAFRLYQAWKAMGPQNCQTLPRFEKYNCEQMFFIAYANTKCGKMTAKAARTHIETSKHSIDKVRVNGAVMHNKEFQQAFKCAIGRPMNAFVKCNLWK